MNIFKKMKTQKGCAGCHDSLLHELAMATMVEHAATADSAPTRKSCQTCGKSWPCPAYQLAQAAEIQARSYATKDFKAERIAPSMPWWWQRSRAEA